MVVDEEPQRSEPFPRDLYFRTHYWTPRRHLRQFASRRLDVRSISHLSPIPLTPLQTNLAHNRTKTNNTLIFRAEASIWGTTQVFVGVPRGASGVQPATGVCLTRSRSIPGPRRISGASPRACPAAPGPGAGTACTASRPPGLALAGGRTGRRREDRGGGGRTGGEEGGGLKAWICKFYPISWGPGGQGGVEGAFINSALNLRDLLARRKKDTKRKPIF